MKLGQRWPEDEMREWEVIFSRILSPFGFEKEIPIEEFIFYITGFMAVLLIYIWCDEYWLEAYNIDYKTEVTPPGNHFNHNSNNLQICRPTSIS